MVSMRGSRISSGSKFEEIAGYSRVAVVPDPGGDWVFVSGTTGFDYALMTIEKSVEAQTHQVFRNISDALSRAGSHLNEVVRIRCFLANPDDFEKVAPIVGKYMHAALPANTTVVTPLIDKRMLIEVEVTARKAAGA
jgi:enamine deaminase RidA (YjgF/YER057c/UK114 family)